MKSRKILCIDFDGVLHSYTSGWQGARTIGDPPISGAFEWLRSLLDWPEEWGAMGKPSPFTVCIYSSRSRQFGGKRAMRKWLLRHGIEREYVQQIKFPTKKPAAYLTIDDRAICFRGEYPSELDLLAFEPYRVTSAS